MNNNNDVSLSSLQKKSRIIDWKVIGAVLLIVGTSIGGGMLALPVTTAKAGFLPSISLLVITWSLMTIGALLMLEICLWFPYGSNLISMVRDTLGRKAEILTWIIYLLLLYCLLSAYIAGGEDLIKGILSLSGISIPNSLALLLFVFTFGGIVCLGIRSVDLINRLIMITKISAFLFISLLILPLVDLQNLTYGTFRPLFDAMTAMITSFGFAIIIPSLRDYFRDDVKKLRLTVTIGCSVPLICYIIWEAIIFGTMHQSGEYSLLKLINTTQPITELMNALAHLSNQNAVIFSAKIFTSVCVITAFLGVALCLTDFLADGFKISKDGLNGLMINCLTFIPPTLLILFIPKLFVFGISFAGVFCILLLILLPAIIALVGAKKYQQQNSNSLILRSLILSNKFLIAIISLGILFLFWGLILNFNGFFEVIKK